MDTLIAIGALAPDFTLRDLKGQMRRLSDYQGKIVLLTPGQRNAPGLSALTKT